MDVKRHQLILLLVLYTVSFPLIIHYLYVNYNQYEQLPQVLRFLDPYYLSLDWALNQASVFSPRIFFVYLLGTLAKFLSPPGAYFLVYLLSVGLVIAATFRLTYQLFKSHLAAILTTILVTLGQSYTLGGKDVIGRDLDPHRLALSLSLVGIILIWGKHHLWAAIFFASAAYIHPLLGFEIPALIYLILIFISIKTQALKLSAIFKSIGFYLFLSLPAIAAFFYAYLTQDQLTVPSSEMLKLITQVKYPYHYLASSWPLFDYIKFSLFLGISLFILKMNYKNLPQIPRLSIILLVPTILIFCLLGYISTELVPNLMIAMLDPFRLVSLVFWLSAIVIYGYCLSQPKLKNSFFAFILPIVPLILASLNFIQHAGNSKWLFIIILLSVLVLFRLKAKITQIVIVILVVLGFSLIYRHFPIHFTQLTPFDNPGPEIRLAQWAKANTPTDSLFLIPPDFSAFRVNSDRAVVVDFILTPFSYNGIYKQVDRLAETSGVADQKLTELSEAKIAEGYLRLNYQQIKQLQQKYHFNYYILTEKAALRDQIGTGSAVYQTDGYVIYQTKLDF